MAVVTLTAAAMIGAGARAADHGLTGPVGPQPQRCSGIHLHPSDDVAAAVARAAPGTTFCFHRGTYNLRSPIIPRSNDAFIGHVDGPAILSGNDGTPNAIRGTWSEAVGVRVAGLIIERFSEVGIDARSSPGSNWSIEHNELRYNGWSGATPAQITRGNYFHRNGVVGLEGGYGSEAMLVENNEFAFNNTKRQYSTGDNGGAKFIRTTRLKVRHNYAHHNDGAGLWTDGNNIFTEYAFNRIEDNTQSGLVHEVSCDATIHDNLLRNNNSETNLWRGGEIYVHSSPNVEVFNNDIRTRGNGVAVRDSHRPADDRIIQQCAVNAREFRIRNVRVRQNRIVQAGRTGMVGEGPGSFRLSNARFEANRYVVPSAGGPLWEWSGSARSWERWQHFGHDAAGSVALVHEAP